MVFDLVLGMGGGGFSLNGKVVLLGRRGWEGDLECRSLQIFGVRKIFEAKFYHNLSDLKSWYFHVINLLLFNSINIYLLLYSFLLNTRPTL